MESRVKVTELIHRLFDVGAVSGGLKLTLLHMNETGRVCARAMLATLRYVLVGGSGESGSGEGGSGASKNGASGDSSESGASESSSVRRNSNKVLITRDFSAVSKTVVSPSSVSKQQ